MASKRGKVTMKSRSIRPGNGTKRRRENAASRRCGPCVACCSAMGITELEKPEWAACENLVETQHAKSRTGQSSHIPVRISDERLRTRGGGGCAAYADRPDSCAKFRCQWLAGMPLTEEKHRPDQCGLIILDTSDPRAVQVRELWEGAASQGVGKDLVVALRRARLEVIVTGPGNSKTLTPLTMFGAPDISVRAAAVR